jgi:glucose/arabinose dehydrogenase
MVRDAKILAVGLCLVAAGCSPERSDGAAGPPENPPLSSPTRPASPAPKSPRASGSFDVAEARIRLETVGVGFDDPLLVTNAGDGSGRLFVAEQGGRIFELSNGRPRRGPYLDLSHLTEASGEQGLLGLAFHPEFEGNGRLFVNYTDNSGDTVIAEYRAAAVHRADPASARVILAFDQPFPNHNGGGLAFGPDGLLYIGVGDGGSIGDPMGNGQSLGTVLGKLLRIDVDRGGDAAYAVPAGNPFVGRAGARPEIWAYGLRNPWRFSFDRSTGDLWVGDVGQDRLEEIDRIEARSPGGVNFGWNTMEGSSCFEVDPCERTGLELPVTQYDHGSGCSVTGGHVYRGARYPELVGGYFFGDYCSGIIWALDSRSRALARPTPLLDTNYSVSSFGESENGELYLTDLASGRVLQVVGARR